MKVFISQSGPRSKAAASALRQWLPDVIQSIEPWMSAEDIDAGARWNSELTNKLAETRCGIICLQLIVQARQLESMERLISPGVDISMPTTTILETSPRTSGSTKVYKTRYGSAALRRLIRSYIEFMINNQETVRVTDLLKKFKPEDKDVALTIMMRMTESGELTCSQPISGESLVVLNEFRPPDEDDDTRS